MKKDRSHEKKSTPEETMKFYEEIISFCSEGVVLVNDKLKITYVTPNITDLLGYPRESLIQTFLPDYVHPDDKNKATSGIVIASSRAGCQIIPRCRVRKSNNDGYGFAFT